MKRLLIGIVVAFLVSGVGVTRRVRQVDCRQCFSSAHETQWRFLGLPVTGRMLGPVRRSRIAEDLFPPPHEHSWCTAGVSGFIVWGTLHDYCAICVSPESSFSHIVSEDSEFRSFLRERLESGELTRDELISMFAEPGNPETTRAQAEAGEASRLKWTTAFKTAAGREHAMTGAQPPSAARVGAMP